MTAFQIERNAFGVLVLTDVDSGERCTVTPVRAFPLSAPEDGVSLVGPDGRERHWIERVDALPAPARALLQEDLDARDFAPTLLKLHSVSSFSVPSTWHIDTDRGETRFVLKAEEDIRRLDSGALQIASAHGLQFRVPDPQALDKPSRKLLDRFL